MVLNGTTFGTPTQLTAEKLKSDYRFRNVDRSDLISILPKGLQNKINVVLPSGGMVVAVNESGQIIMNNDGTPAVWDLTEVGFLDSEVLGYSRSVLSGEIYGQGQEKIKQSPTEYDKNDLEKILQYRESR